MRQRLFLQIYLTMLGIVALFVALVIVGWWLSRDDSSRGEFRSSIGALVAEALPPQGAPPAEMDAVLNGDLGTIFEWAGIGRESTNTDIPMPEISVKVVCGGSQPPRPTYNCSSGLIRLNTLIY